MRLTDAPRFLILTQSDWRPRDTGHWRFRVEPVEGQGTFEAAGEESGCSRDRLDLWAVVRGLESLNQSSHLTLITASNYVSRGFRFGLPEWRERDWCWESYGRWTEIRDVDLWRRVDVALQYHRVDCRFWSLSKNFTPNPTGATATAPQKNSGGRFGLWDRLRRFRFLPSFAGEQMLTAT